MILVLLRLCLYPALCTRLFHPLFLLSFSCRLLDDAKGNRLIKLDVDMLKGAAYKTKVLFYEVRIIENTHKHPFKTKKVHGKLEQSRFVLQILPCPRFSQSVHKYK